MTDRDLYLHQEILLLALRDEEGTVPMGTWHQMAMGGAVLADLVRAGRLAIDDDKKAKVRLEDATPLGEPVLDECLEKVAAARRPAAAQTWVSRFANLRRLHHRVAQSLCRLGVLRMDEERLLLLFKRKVYPEIDPTPERALLERLRQAIYGDGEVDPKTALLIALAQPASVLVIAFPKKELKARKKRLEAITSGDALGQATSAAIKAVQAAVMIATTTAATSAAVTTT